MYVPQLYVWQNCDSWTANWALSMLVTLSQSLTQWEGTQHVTSGGHGPEPCTAVVQHQECYVCGAHLYVRQNSDTWTLNWALSMPGLCPRNYFAPTARSRCAHDCLSKQQLQKTTERRLPHTIFPASQNCLWRCHARCLTGLGGSEFLWKFQISHNCHPIGILKKRPPSQTLLSIVVKSFLGNLLF